MPKKKDAAIIGVVLLLAVALFAVSKMMPRTDLSTKTADVTLAPDAVEYLDETPAPEATAEPQPTEGMKKRTNQAAVLGTKRLRRLVSTDAISRMTVTTSNNAMTAVNTYRLASVSVGATRMNNSAATAIRMPAIM